jgi:LmbE family N-acetylglucosaminyl deacetylase
MIAGKSMLVVSAHAADYVWRSGGTIAKYIAEGADVHVVVLSSASAASPTTCGSSRTRPPKP